MTREELRDYVEEQRSLDMIPYHVYSTLIDGIDTLEQEPIIDKVKQARDEISDWDVNKVMDGCSESFKLGVAKGLDIASVILDKLIESEG